MGETLKVKLFILQRTPKDRKVFKNFAKDWALLVQVFEEDELDYEELVEGSASEYENRMVMVLHHYPYGKKKRGEWESAQGYERVAVNDKEDYHEIPADDFIDWFCNNKNKEQEEFVSVYHNSHAIIEEFLNVARVEVLFMPETAEEAGKNLAKRPVSILVKRSIGHVFANICKWSILPRAIAKIQDVMQVSELEIGNKILDPILKKLIERLGGGEKVIEQLTRGMRSATSPLQLLKIPIEILSYSISKLMGADENAAQMVGTLSGIASAAGIGMWVGGPAGAVFSVVLHLAGMVVAWLMRKLFDWILVNVFPKIIAKLGLGESPIAEILEWIGSKVLNFFVAIPRLIKSCIDEGEEWVTTTKNMLEEQTKPNEGMSKQTAALFQNLGLF